MIFISGIKKTVSCHWALMLQKVRVYMLIANFILEIVIEATVILSRLHVGWNTGGTVAGESIIAGTVGNDTTAVSALLTLKNAGNRGAQGASGGSSLAKFEFNNGTAFEIDKYGRRTLQYQPACKVSIDTNSTGGGNNTQTGNTVLPLTTLVMVIILETISILPIIHLRAHYWKISLKVLLSVNVIGDNIVYIYKNGSTNMGGGRIKSKWYLGLPASQE